MTSCLSGDPYMVPTLLTCLWNRASICLLRRLDLKEYGIYMSTFLKSLWRCILLLIYSQFSVEWPIQAIIFCFFRCSTHSTFSSWAASSCGVLIIIMFTPLVYSSSQSFPSVFHFMRSVRSVRLTCVYCFPLNMEKIIEMLCDHLFCSKASLFTKWPTLSQMSQCWDSRRVSFWVEFGSNIIAILMTTIMRIWLNIMSLACRIWHI